MSRAAQTWTRSLEGFPRVSGDEPHLDASFKRVLAFSPRERG